MKRAIALGILLTGLAIIAGCAGNVQHESPAAGPDAAAQFGPAPAGVDQAFWGELTNRLASELARVKASSVQLPSATDAMVSDFALDSVEGDIVTLSWSFRNPGDYDQNGEVNAADLVPIAAHYKAREGDPGWAAAQIADGDGNTEVNSGDVVEIARHWRNAVKGYVFGVEFGDYNHDNSVSLEDMTTLGATGLCESHHGIYGGFALQADWQTPRLSDSDPCKGWLGVSLPDTGLGVVPAGGGAKRFTHSFRWIGGMPSLYFCVAPIYCPGDDFAAAVTAGQMQIGALSNNVLAQQPALP